MPGQSSGQAEQCEAAVFVLCRYPLEYQIDCLNCTVFYLERDVGTAVTAQIAEYGSLQHWFQQLLVQTSDLDVGGLDTSRSQPCGQAIEGCAEIDIPHSG